MLVAVAALGAVPAPAGAGERTPILVSLQAERTVIERGGRMTTECMTWLFAQVHPATAGRKVTFSIRESTGGGFLSPASISARSALTDADGTAWALLLSSDREEACVVTATDGVVRLSTSVDFRADPGKAAWIFPPTKVRDDGDELPPVSRADAARIMGLIEKLGDPEAQVRTAARKGLVAEGRKSVPFLTRLLYDPSKPRHVRGMAAAALGDLKDDFAVRKLARALTDPRSYVRDGAVGGLSGHASESARKYVAKSLLHSKAYVRVDALRTAAGMDIRQATPQLVAAARDPAGAVRATAGWLLKEADGPKARKALLSLMSDDEDFVRAVAAKSMIFVGGGTIPKELLQASSDPFPGTRASVARALGVRPGGGGLDVLARLALDPDIRVVRNAALAVADRASEPEAMDQLLRLVDSADPYVARTARRAVCLAGGEEQAGLIVRLLGSGDGEIAALSAGSLRRLTRRDISYPANGTAAQKARAVELWQRWWARHGAQGRRRWLALALRERTSTLRGEAALELARLGDESVKTEAKRLLRDRFWTNRHGAALALAELQDYSGSAAVAADLKDKRWYVRAKAVEVLSRLADTASIEALITGGLDDPAGTIRARALSSLRRLTGGRHGFDPDGTPLERQRSIARWKFWWAREKDKYPGPKAAK